MDRRAKSVPAHVAIIMDGNGRWAKARGMPRTEGHKVGLNVAKDVVRSARHLGVQYLSLYTFSTENWKRAATEVGFLMSLIRSHLLAELDFYRKEKVRIVHSGDRNALPQDVLSALDSAQAQTEDFAGITVNLALNYGGRNEIVRSVCRAVQELGRAPANEEEMRKYLDVPELPDPDLIIRTGGDIRLSNFLLWQSAYAELYFTDQLWPDFSGDGLAAALKSFETRERKFGGTS